MNFKSNILKSDLIYYLILTVALLVFVVFKIPYLSLGYFWDEAWSYAPAVRLMDIKGLSMLPDALPVWNSRGHPLLFYFLSAGWIKLFGNSFVAVHSFCVLVSVSTLISLFVLLKKLVSNEVAIISVLIFMVQPIFLAQSGMLLPEMLITLFSVLTILGLFQSNKIVYLIFGSMLVMTKETGLVLIGSAGLWTLIDHFGIEKQKLNLNLLKKLAIVSLPLLVIGIYLVIQRKMLGWFLYPEHVGMMTFSLSEVKSKFVGCITNTFLSQNKRYLLISLFILLVVSAYLKPKWSILAKKLCFFVPLFMVFYFAFSALNFFTIRYLLCVIPLFIVIVVTVAYYVLKNKIVFYLLGCGLIMVGIFSNKTENGISDINLKYKNMCIMQQKMVNYCLSKNWQQKNIYASFLNMINLTDVGAGYLGTNQPFKKVGSTVSDSVDYWVFFPMEDNTSVRNKLIQNHKIQLIERIEEGGFWYEFYKTIN